MRPTIAVAIALALFLSGGAEGADLIQLAETGGFLLGNASRCGVPTDRVEHAGQVIHAMIATASCDPDEEARGFTVCPNLYCERAPGPRRRHIDPNVQDGDCAVRTPRATSSANRHALNEDRRASIAKRV